MGEAWKNPLRQLAAEMADGERKQAVERVATGYDDAAHALAMSVLAQPGRGLSLAYTELERAALAAGSALLGLVRG